MVERQGRRYRLDREKLEDFYSAKYNYYKDFSIKVILLAILVSAAMWIVDCLIIGGMSLNTILPRMAMLLLLYPYMKITRLHNYKTNIVLSYLVLYMVDACVIWVAIVQGDNTHLSDTFTMLQLFYMAFGMAVPRELAQGFHLGHIIALLLANIAIPELNLLAIIVIQAIAYFGIQLILNALEMDFMDKYSSSEEKDKLIVHDQLTKAFNRNKIQEMCLGTSNELEIKRAAFLLFDIDFFKKVNDNYGHDAGDKVLQNLVDITKLYVRKTDYIVRWGGEEFLIILPDCGEGKAKNIANTIRESVQAHPAEMCGATLSIGIAIYYGGDYNETVKKADKALYYAKEHGRNKVVMINDIEEQKDK